MKLAIKIIKAILIIILTVIIIGILIIKTLSATILDEAYVYRMIQTSKYYENIYKEVQSNFENYIGPSGVDENILKEVCTAEDIQKDTETILGNIYEGTGKKINTEEIRKRIVNNINKAVQKQENIITEKMQASINKFAEVVADEYINTISHTEYEEKINDAYRKITKLISTAQKVLFIGIAVIVILLILLNIKTLNLIISNLGIAIASSGAFLTISNYIINSKIKIEQMKFLNNSISTVLQNIIKDILNQATNIGWQLLIAGTVAIIIGAFLKARKTEE